MDKLNKEKAIFIIVIYAVLCISFLYIILKSSPEFLIHNSFIIVIPVCFFISIIIEISTFFFKDKKYVKPKSIRIITSAILCITIVLSYLYNKTEEINNDNAGNYIRAHINMSDFLNTDNIVIHTSGEAYRSLFTKEYCLYATGAIYETDLPVSGIQNEYIEFRKNIISKLLADKYFNNVQSKHEYTENNGVLFCKENILNQNLYYILIKKDNRIYSTKIYSQNTDDTSVLNAVKEIDQF